MCDYNDKFGIRSDEALDIYKGAVKFLNNKKDSESDTTEIRSIK